MEQISEAMHMPMYSRYGKAQASFVNIPVISPRRALHKPKPHRQQMDSVTATQGKIATIIQQMMTYEEQKQDSQLRHGKKTLSAAFLTVSRQQRDQTQKPTNTETPGPTKYYPNEALIRPKTTNNHRMRVPTTSPRPRILPLAPCLSEGNLTCKYAKKAYHGVIVGKGQSPPPGTHTVPAEEHHKGPTDEEADLAATGQLSSARTFSFEKQTPRKGIGMMTVSDSRFDTINHFPVPYTGSKRVYTADFRKATSRKDMFVADQVDGVYDTHPERCKARTDVCLLDYSKMSPRVSVSPKFVPESPNFDRIEKGYQLVLPRSHVAKVNIGKMSPRPGTAGPGLTWMGYISIDQIKQSSTTRKASRA